MESNAEKILIDLLDVKRLIPKIENHLQNGRWYGSLLLLSEIENILYRMREKMKPHTNLNRESVD